MLRTAAVVSLGLAALTLGASSILLADRSAAHAATPSAEGEDRIVMSPVLIVTRAGSTLLGRELDQLTVYSDGLVMMAGAVEHTGARYASQGRVDTADVVALGRELLRLGAHELDDQEYDVTDTPLTTVSVATRVGPTVQVNSYSYWLADDGQAVVEGAIQDWLTLHHLVAIEESGAGK